LVIAKRCTNIDRMYQNLSGNALFYTLSISSCPSELSRVDLFLRRILQKHNFPEPELEDIVLAVHEGVTNAIAHGNRHCVSAPVQIFVRVEPKRLRIAIRDYGRGFDPRKISDPTREENIERFNGRGLLFIRNFVDEVSFSRSGLCHQLVLTKFRPK